MSVTAATVQGQDASRRRMVRASAGAGKTYTLSLRYLKLLARGHAAGSILATTFTRAAAGEISRRVLARLARAAEDEAEARTLAGELERASLDRRGFGQLLREVCDALDRLAISTLDSFFSKVAMGFRHELGVPAGVTPVGEDDPLARELRMEAIEAMLAESDPQVLVELLRRLHHDAAGRSVTAAIDGIVSKLYETYLEAPDAAVWSRLRASGELDEAEVAEAVEGLRMAGDLLANEKRMAKAWGEDIQRATERRWEEFLGKGLAGKITEGGTRTFYNKPIPDNVVDVYEPLVTHAAAQAIGKLARATRATHELLEKFHTHYLALRQRRRVMLFADPPRMLAERFEAGGDDLMNEVYYRLDGIIHHLMFDEFQDTSLSQWRVLRPLAGEICLSEDAGRTFFCVGDVKQAIYGWRGGCAAVFDLVEKQMHLPAEAVTQSNVNYRSSQTILDCVAKVVGSYEWNEALSEETARAAAVKWAGRFQAHTARRDRPGYVELCSSLSAGEEEEEGGGFGEAEENGDEGGEGGEGSAALGAHEKFVAQKVAEIAQRAPGSTIGVLVMRNAMVQPLVHLIGEAVRPLGLTVSGEAGNALTDDPAVLAVLAAMTLADHPGDTLARFQVERSPLAGAAEFREPVERWASGVRAALLEEGYAKVIQGWVMKLARAGACNRRNLARLAQLVELAEKYDQAASLRPGRFVTFVRQTKVQEPTPASIRVMTIHRSKGLEFDAVVLPQLAELLGVTHRNPAYVLRDGETGPVTAVYRGAKEAARKQSAELEAAYQQERARRLADDFSGLYVAMTRARAGLYMIVPPLKRTASGKPGTVGWTNLTYSAVLRQALSTLGEDEGFEGGRVLFSQGVEEWWGGQSPKSKVEGREGGHERDGSIAFAGGGVRRRSWPGVTPSSLEGEGLTAVAELLGLGGSPAARRGRVIHAMFQEVGWVGEPGGEPEDAALRAAALKVAPEAKAKAEELARWIAEFRGMLGMAAVRACLSRGTEDAEAELWRERPFAVKLDGKLMQGIMDRVVVRREGGKATWARVIDFKTDSVDGGADEALQEAVERYRPQVRAYRRVAGGMLGLEESKVSAALVFVGPGVTVEVD